MIILIALALIYTVFRYLLLRDLFSNTKYCDELSLPHKWGKHKNSLGRETLKCSICGRIFGES